MNLNCLKILHIVARQRRFVVWPLHLILNLLEWHHWQWQLKSVENIKIVPNIKKYRNYLWLVSTFLRIAIDVQ